MKIIVTGGDGFLGRVLRLSLKSHTVFNYDITTAHSILDTVQLEQIFSTFQPEAVIHLAATADLNLYTLSPSRSEEINVVGTQNILAMCEKYGARLLFASTCCSYGNTRVHPSTEETPPEPTEPYAESKVISEQHILQKGLPHCCMRLGTFYGPAMRPALAPAIFLDRAHHNFPIDIHGDGNQTRTMTYIDDIVAGIIQILESEPLYTIINVTSEEITSVNKMIQIALALSGNDVPLNYIQDRTGQIYKENISSQRLQSLGWTPTTSFADGMRRSYEFYIKNGNKWT